MTVERLGFLGLVLAVAFPAFAQGPAGKWSANVETPNVGSVPTNIELKVDGERLTGTFSNSFIPTPLPIQDGTFKGNEISFKLGLRSMTLMYKGVLAGDELTLTTSVVDGPASASGAAGVTFTARRVK